MLDDEDNGIDEQSHGQVGGRDQGTGTALSTEPPIAAVCVPTLRNCGLLTDREGAAVDALLAEDGIFALAIDLADSIHLHIEVNDTERLPVSAFLDAGAVMDHRRDGYVKFRFPDGLNAIFSHIRIAQEEAVVDDDVRRPRPYLDHLGVDLRAETAPVRAAFNAIPVIGTRLGWGYIAQGGEAPVYCCHVSVERKHWLYPNSGALADIPLEFAYGALILETGKAGCDLRPAPPSRCDSGARCC